jgi:beta-lactamase regulating signal transducer with metallopeptidase domain
MIEIINWICRGFEATWMAAVAAVPFALVVFLLDASVCRRMPARFRGLLWTLVAVRMLMPFAPASPLSLGRLWMPVLAKAQSTSAPNALLVAPYSRPPESWLTTRNDYSVQYLGRTNPFPAVAVAEVDWADIMFSCCLYAWFAGATIVLLRASIASIRFARRLRTIPSVHDGTIVALLDRVCGQVGVRRRPHVKYVADLPAPAVFGVFRPTLCLPEATRDQLSDGQLRMIMLHEVMHLRRHDGYLAWLLTAVRATHWWNPISWLVISRVSAYREEACDDGVRQHTELTDRRTYVDLLLQFAAARPTANLGLIGIWFARPVRRLSARINAFAVGDEVRRRIYWPVAVALLGLLAAAGLTDATNFESKETEPQTVGDFLNGHGIPPTGATPRAFEFGSDDGANDPQKDAVEERTYDVTHALAKLAEINPHADAKQWLMMYSRFPGHSVPSIHQDGNHSQLQLSTTRQQHTVFSSMLAGIERSGPWQVMVEARVFRNTDIDAIDDINWQDAVKFPLPPTRKAASWPAQSGGAQSVNNNRLSLSVESVSYEFAPYLALVIDAEKMRRITERFQQHPNPNFQQMNVPKITLFSGLTANIRDEAQRPFVVGVNYVKGQLATAAQPEIAVLSEGVRLDVRPLIIDKNKLDLQCMLAVSFIDDVKTTKLPGQEITVQNPRASRKEISTRCQLAPGQTLLLAQLPPNGDDKKVGFLCFAISASWFPDEAPATFVK